MTRNISMTITAEHHLGVARKARELGHNPLRQGDSFECHRCGCSGTLHPTLVGKPNFVGNLLNGPCEMTPSYIKGA